MHPTDVRDAAGATVPQAKARLWRLAILSAAVFALLLKLALAWNTFGTNDVYAWERFSFWSRLLGAGAYRANPDFNHPPSMIHLLSFIGWLSETTGIGFPFWIRLPAILADTGSLWLVWRLLRPRLHIASVRWGILLVALSPALILISGFHGNTDPEMIFFMLLSVWLTGTGANDWMAGAAVGAAMCFKVVPVIAIPAMFFYRRGFRRRGIFLASLLGVIVLAWSPYILREPVFIFQRVFGYRTLYSVWGITWLLDLATSRSPQWQGLNSLFQSYGGYVVIGAIGAFSYRVNRRVAKPDLFRQVGASMSLFLAAANGFGVQYLAWLVPWIAGVDIFAATVFSAAGGIYLFLTYDYWAGGLPWYLADVNYRREYHGQLDVAAAICWLSVVLLAWSAWRRDSDSPRRRALLWIAAAGVLAYPMVRYSTDAKRPTDGDRITVTKMRGDDYVDLAVRIESVGKNWGNVGAADRALALDPDLKAATIDIPTVPLASLWDTLAESYADRGRWDESIMAAQKALRVDPGFEKAASGLARGLAGKKQSLAGVE